MSKGYFGWSGRILQVDLDSKEIQKLPLPEDLALKFIGQSGVNAALLYRLCPPKIRPFDPKAPLILGVGPLGGTPAPCSGRFSVTFKSPLTGIFADSNCGGHFGPELKMAGFDHLIVTGASDHPVYLLIDNGQIELRSATELWGLNTSETEEHIKSELGDRTFQIACIGPAGESLVRFAAIIANKARAAARGGPGAVMGAKKLKAIAVRGDLGLKIWDPAGFETACQKAQQAIVEDPLYSQASTYGTACITGMAQALGFLPTRNFQESTFEGASCMFGDVIQNNYLTRHKGCFNCPISCSKYCTVSSGEYKGTEGEGPEYESITAFSAKCGNSNLPSVLHANMICNRLGLDTISAGSTIAWAMECFERGILTQGTAGLDLAFGNHQQMNELLYLIAHRQGIGDILAKGALQASRQIGGEDYVVHNKGLEYPGVDVRGTKGMALGFAVSPRGGDHLKGLPLFEVAPDVYNKEMQQELGITPGGSYWLEYEGKPEFMRWHEDWHCVVDSLGLCKLEGIAIKPLFPRHFLELFQTATGCKLDIEDLRRAGERIWNLERAFNARLGLGKKEDMPPSRMLKDPIRTGPAMGELLEEEKFMSMLEEYYRQRGRDPDSGIPDSEKLKELGLEQISVSQCQPSVYF
ncbi:MAG: aldehyde ferredoxin oxidoreductase family protein [Desulfohalobiaceae bacterium]